MAGLAGMAGMRCGLRRALGALAMGAGVMIVPVSTAHAETYTNPGRYTVQVPAGVTSVSIEAAGGSGSGFLPGSGAVVSANDIAVEPCTELTVVVGVNSTGSDAATGSVVIAGETAEVLAAAGAGGGSGQPGPNGDGGDAGDGASSAVGPISGAPQGGTVIAGEDGEDGFPSSPDSQRGLGGDGGGTTLGSGGAGGGSAGSGGSGTAPDLISDLDGGGDGGSAANNGGRGGSGGGGFPFGGGGGGGGDQTVHPPGTQGFGVGGGGGGGASFVTAAATSFTVASGATEAMVTVTFGAGSGSCDSPPVPPGPPHPPAPMPVIADPDFTG